MSAPGSAASTPERSQVLSWALWDFGSLGVSSVVGTFVFSVYLTRGVGDDLPGGTSPASWLGRALAIAGLLVALLAPVTGVGLKATVMPAGAPVAVNAMSPVSPPTRASVTVDVALPPCAMLSVAGASVTVTPGGAAVTVTGNVAVPVAPPVPVPVNVTL